MLTIEQLKDIEHLQKECESHDQLQLKLNWEMLRSRETDQLDYFHYENNELIAFLGLYAFGSTVEVCGMVKPSERRKGHFQKLFNQGMKTAKHIGYKKTLLNAPASSNTAKAFLANQNVKYSHSEHQMQWMPSLLGEVEGVTLRLADSNDTDLRIRLEIEAFGLSEEDARHMNEHIDGDHGTDMFMIEADGETVGKIRLRWEERETWIYGFSVLPEYQGKGIGRKVLKKVVNEQNIAGQSVHLEVETENAHALRLYESVGFKVVHAQDYYTYNY